MLARMGLFAAAELGHELSKRDWEEAQPELRVDLVNAQYDLRSAPFEVLVLVEGDHRIGCQRLVHDMFEWMDGRYLRAAAFDVGGARASGRPPFARYWDAMPGRGITGLFLDGWTSEAIAERMLGALDAAAFERRIGAIQRFERLLVEDGTLLLKFWLHLPAAAREKELARAAKYREQMTWLTAGDWELAKQVDAALPIAEHAIEHTGRAAPWHVVESTDTSYRNRTVAESLRSALRARLALPATAAEPATSDAAAVIAVPDASRRSVLDSVDGSQALEKKDYQQKLARWQGELGRLSLEARTRQVPTLLVFEGWDAAGKGGVIRRVTSALNVRHYVVHAIAAPTPEERNHHYLWRFWRRIPEAGCIGIFDRSWYGRVLVERVEGFASPAEWSRAYTEIRDFEEQLTDAGCLVLKFWLHIDPEEQLARFQAREQTAYKKHKITDEDYRNRQQWGAYTAAVDDMVARTSTDAAPWHLIAANQKRFARVEVLKTLCKALKRRL